MIMPAFTITCLSGAVVLVSARSADIAEREWDRLVKSGDAEERIAGTTERASRADIRLCISTGHDYR